MESGLCCGGNAELRRVGLAKDDQPRCLVALDQRGVVVRHRVLVEFGGARGDGALEANAEILQKKRNAAERPVGQTLIDGLFRQIKVALGDGVDFGVKTRRSLHGLFEKLMR